MMPGHDYTVLTQPTKGPKMDDPKRYGLRPVSTVCQYCESKIITNTQFVEGALTYLLVAGFCLTGLICGCCLLPFYWDGCKDLIHSCPVCGSAVGYYNRLCPASAA